MTTPRNIKLTVNGSAHERTVEPRTTLADFLRNELRLTGTHIGCEHGVCGACTVLVDEQAVRACLMFAVQADGATVRTVESLGTPEKLNPLQQAFTDHHALQCGFCTPGILMTLTEYMEQRKPDAPLPTEAEIRDLLSGNICRCTGYQYIVDAALAVIGQNAGGV
jgi:aerobic carbon-monoxide dehydrogenase small subunit